MSELTDNEAQLREESRGNELADERNDLVAERNSTDWYFYDWDGFCEPPY